MATTIANGAIANVTIPVGQALKLTGSGTVQIGAGSDEVGQIYTVNGPQRLGPWTDQTLAYLTCLSGLSYELIDPNAALPSADLTAADVARVRAASGLAAYLPRALNKANKQMASPPTVSTSTVASQISGGRVYPLGGSGNASYPYIGASAIAPVSVCAGAQYSGVVTTNAAGTNFQNQSFRYLANFDGTEIEFRNQSSGGAYWIKVDGEYIDEVGVTLAADAVTRNIKVTFPQRTQCRIEFISYGLNLVTVTVDATAGISPAEIRGPRCIIIGDSFNATPASYPRKVADMLGWDDVWNSGMGGTGVIATNGGASQNFEQRLEHDALQYSPHVLWVVGSVNDDSQPAQVVIDALLRMRAAYLASRPDGFFIWSPNASNGPSSWTAKKNLIRWRARAALSDLPATFVVDPLEAPMVTYNALPSGQVRAVPTVGSNTIQIHGQQPVGGFPQSGSTIRINDDTYEVKTAAFGGSDPGKYWFALTIDGTVKTAHAVGSTWTQLGASYITGSGSAGNPSGYGSSDAYRISAGDIHPTSAGQNAFGQALAAGLMALA